MRSILFYLLAGNFFLSFYACAQKEKADLVLRNGQVYTVNKDQPAAEAVAVKNGKILFVGSDEELKAFIGDRTEVIDCNGKFVIPGFIEGHGHIHGLGASLLSLDLMHVKNWDEIVALVAEAVKKAKPGDWIIGRGWHQEKWDHAPEKNFLGYPYHEELDKVSPGNPVMLSHASGHSSYVNAKALEMAGISNSTRNPSGGNILKDNNGAIVGVLEENAQGLVYQVYNDWLNNQTEDEQKASWQKSIALAEEDCLKKGIATFQDAGSTFKQVQWMKELAEAGKLNIRFWVMVRESYARLISNKSVFPIVDYGNGYLTVKAVKVQLDGALGSYGAWLLEPYADRPGWTGLNTFNVDSLKAIAAFCRNNNLQLCVHAIGDRANRETINIFSEQIRKDNNRDQRWRIEHAQHVSPADIPRFKEWNIIASMQGIHCTSDALFVIKRLGTARAESGAYMWKAFLDEGVVVNNGTDTPVEDEDPIACYYASVTRRLKDGTAFFPAQKMTREEAIYSYTMANAYASFQEKEKGSLEIGKLADIAVLSHNLITSGEEDIQKTKVLMTIVGGKVKYRSDGF